MTTSSNRTARRGAARRVPAPAPSGRPQKPSEYTGVRLRQWGRWVAEVRVPGTRQKLWIGTFETDRQAALAYDAALLCLKGSDAVLNFPTSSPSSSASSSHRRADKDDDPAAGGGMSPRSIQRAAAAAAAAIDDAGMTASADDRCSSSACATTPTSASLSSTQGSTDHVHQEQHATTTSSAAASTGSPPEGEELWTYLEAFASPKFMDLVDTGAAAPFSSTWEEPEDDGELMRLWSFC